MPRFVRTALFISAAFVVCAAEARADSMTIGGPGCVSCQGATYTLNILGLAPDVYPGDNNLFDTYRVSLTIDTSGYSGGGMYIDEVAVKISSSVNDANIYRAPDSSGASTAAGASMWNLVPGGLNADGCSGSGSGFDCADWVATGLNRTYILPGAVLTWVFDIDVSGPLFSFSSTNPDLLPSIKARYVDGADNKVGALVSEKVPEPTTLALLGVGMSLAAIRRRRAQR